MIKTEGSKTSVVYISFPIFQKERKARNVVEREKEKKVREIYSGKENESHPGS